MQAPSFVPKRWRSDSEQETRRAWLVYCGCRIVGHKVNRGPDGWHYCTRCGDTLPQGSRRWQP